jgi:hypothetical protein
VIALSRHPVNPQFSALTEYDKEEHYYRKVLNVTNLKPGDKVLAHIIGLANGQGLGVKDTGPLRPFDAILQYNCLYDSV